jgi:glyoxylase-like metal-dependent hydrolase (beta-lactamase superfamily II)
VTQAASDPPPARDEPRRGALPARTEAVLDGIYRIPVPLPGNPLKELNGYLLRGRESDLLIDLGFRMPECREALMAGLSELGSSPERVDVLLTHLHSDHSGLADEFGENGRRVYMTGTDIDYLRGIRSGTISRKTRARFVSEGFPEDVLAEVENANPAWKCAPRRHEGRFHALRDGDVIAVGDYRLRTVLTPGHTPGNAMFWLEEQKLMFTGDHVLFDITPNITSWTGIEDALGDYLESLRKSRAFPVEIALPGHRKPGPYHERIDRLLAHHERRLAEARGVIGDQPGLTAYEIASFMKWKIRADDWQSFPPVQKWFAVGECLSHLDYLRLRGEIVCLPQGGIRRWYAAGFPPA